MDALAVLKCSPGSSPHCAMLRTNLEQFHVLILKVLCAVHWVMFPGTNGWDAGPLTLPLGKYCFSQL